MTDEIGTEQEQCEEEYNCVGKVDAHLCGSIVMRCECPCPTYADKFHMFPPNTQREDIQPAMQAVIAGAPQAQFGSLLDLGHVGWMLHYRVPA